MVPSLSLFNMAGPLTLMNGRRAAGQNVLYATYVICIARSLAGIDLTMSGITTILLGDQPFLRGLPAGDLARLADTTVTISVPAGHRLFEAGSRAEKFWLLTTGHVALDVGLPGRARLDVETLGPGEVLGLSWLSPPYQWQVNARATEPVTALQLDGLAVIALCDSKPAFGYQLTRRMLEVSERRLQATRRRLLEICSATGWADAGLCGLMPAEPPGPASMLAAAPASAARCRRLRPGRPAGCRRAAGPARRDWPSRCGA